jgi:hypothetical protein
MLFWKRKWGYIHSTFIIISLILNGIIIEYFTIDQGLKAPKSPYGLILLFIYGILIYTIYKERNLFKLKSWLISKSFVISLICSIALMAMVSGYIPQRVNLEYPLLQQLGLFHITSSMPFVILCMLLMISLGVTILNRLFPFRFRNIAFLINHIGILILLIGGLFSSGDLQKVRINLSKDRAKWEGYLVDNPSVKVQLPFALKLNNFILEEYDHDLAIIDNNNEVIKKCGTLTSSATGELCTFHGKKIILKSFIHNAFKVEDKYIAVSHVGTSPVANIEMKDLLNKVVKSGYVVQGSNLQDTKYFHIDHNFKLAIPVAKPKSFKSTGHYFTHDNETGTFELFVNKPFRLKGFDLYQTSYDEKMGKWSNTSMIEAVYDPWLPTIYIGAFLMIIGSIFLMFPSEYFLEKKDD